MIIPVKNFPLILSASRMTDMPMFYPEDIIKETEKRINNGLKIHTLVLWTKFPRSLLINPLLDYLLYLKSLQYNCMFSLPLPEWEV